MQHKFITIALASAMSLTTTVTTQADILGFRIGGYSWSQEYSGDVQSSAAAIDEVDINDDLGIDDETGTTFYVALEHPIPLLPNIMLQQTDLEVEETSSPTKTFTFEGQTFSVSDQITTTSDLSHTDATLYYEILDNWVSLDLGLTIRQFSEGIELSSSTTTTELDIDATVPMLYLAAKAELPLTGLYVDAQVNGISVGDATLLDYKAALGYETSIGLGIDAGLRNFEIDYDDDDEQANLTIDGAFVGVFYHF